jgi:transposase
MSGFIEGEDRHQATLFPERLDDYVAEDNPVRVIDVFIDDLDISGPGFKSEAAATGRPGYHPKTMLKLYVYGCRSAA